MNLIACSIKSFLSLFAIMRLTGLSTNSPFSILFFFIFLYLFVRLSENSVQAVVTDKDTRLSFLAALLFSVLTIAADYSKLLQGMNSTLFCIVILLLSFAGLFLLYYYAILLLLTRSMDFKPDTSLYPVVWLPAIAFFACLLAWLPYFLHEYPAIMTPDSINQYAQVIGAYELSNHHSVVHTLMIGFLYDLGMKLTGDVSFSLALYTICQMIFMAFVAAYVIRTLQMAHIKTSICVIVICFYALIPYHGIYAVTMWKDIPFAGCMTLFAAAMLRFLLRNEEVSEDNKKLKFSEYITLLLPYIFAGFMICLLRTNGWYAFLISLPFILYYGRNQLKLMIPVHLVLLALVLFVKYPCMNIYEIKQADFVESLSIPVQQIAKVIANGESLTEEQASSLQNFMDIEQAAIVYQPDVSDNIKNLIRETGNEYLESHKGEFFSLWLSVGINHPKAYFDAYFSQTNGFWYPDVSYEVGLADGIYPNEFGLVWQPILRGNVVVKIREILFKLHELIPLYGFLWSMGGMFWTILLMQLITIRNNRYMGFLIAVPAIMLVLTLCIATPVATEFRYAYALFFGLPLYLLAPFIRTK